MIRRADTPTDRASSLAWLASRLGTTPRDLVWTYPHELLVVSRGGRIVGVVLYIHWRGRSIEAHWAGEPGWLTKDALRAMFAFPFDVLGVKRLVGLIPATNTTARAAAEKMGFGLEGVAREAEDDGADLALYAMLKRECRWIDNGQEKRTDLQRQRSNRVATGGERQGVQFVSAGGWA